MAECSVYGEYNYSQWIYNQTNTTGGLLLKIGKRYLALGGVPQESQVVSFTPLNPAGRVGLVQFFLGGTNSLRYQNQFMHSEHNHETIHILMVG